MVSQWTADGAARKALMTQDATQSLTAIFTGMGSLSYGELAGERMKLGLLLNDPEEEHDCFADNTHNSHYYDVVGIRNVYLGSYTRIDGSVVQGPSVSDLVKTADYNVDRRLQAALADTLAKFQVLVARAETTEAYDQMLAEGNTEGNATVQTAIDALLAQTKEIERAVAVLNIKTIEFEGSDSLDTPSKVAQ